MVFEKEYIMRCSSAEWVECLEMMLSWCRQVNWGNSGIPCVNCAVLCERRPERIVMRPAVLPVKTAQFTQFFREVWRHTVKSLKFNREYRTLYGSEGACCMPGVEYRQRRCRRLFWGGATCRLAHVRLGYEFGINLPNMQWPNDTAVFSMAVYVTPSCWCVIAVQGDVSSCRCHDLIVNVRPN